MTDKDAIYNKGWQDGWDEAVKSMIPKIHPKLKCLDPDYWTRLEHQYAGMAMQGILANIDLLMSLAKKKADDYPAKYTVAEFAKDCAHALVEKLKEKEERK